MTTQEKTTAIQKIIANQKDNLAAVTAAHLPPGFDVVVPAAMNEALKADLEAVFALNAK